MMAHLKQQWREHYAPLLSELLKEVHSYQNALP